MNTYSTKGFIIVYCLVTSLFYADIFLQEVLGIDLAFLVEGYSFELVTGTYPRDAYGDGPDFHKLYLLTADTRILITRISFFFGVFTCILSLLFFVFFDQLKIKTYFSKRVLKINFAFSSLIIAWVFIIYLVIPPAARFF